MLYRFGIIALLSMLAVANSMALAADKKTFDNPREAAKADPDFRIQGEYSGTLDADGEKVKLGVQVIALGGGKFQAVTYMGGLPGDGWNGEKPSRTDGWLSDGAVKFAGDGGYGILSDRKIAISSEGNSLGSLDRVRRKSLTLGKKPAAGAIVLFNGKSVDEWKNGKMTDHGLLMQGTSSKKSFQSGKLHLEFRLPYMPEARGQGRGNSGLYLQGRYEVQMLDSFGLEGKDNECGGIYSIKDPDLNMCYPPLRWQTYDVEFVAGQYDSSGAVTTQPYMTVYLNGVKVHDKVKLPKSTTAAPNNPGATPGPIYLQDHGNPMRYRNIWFKPASE